MGRVPGRPRGLATNGAFARALVAMALLQALPTTVRAQADADARAAPAAVLLEAGHWAVEVVRRLDAAGLVAGYVPAQRSASLATIEALLAAAEARASTENDPLVTRIGEWRRLLQLEYPGLVDRESGAGPEVLGQRVGFAVTAREGGVSPGLGEFDPDRTGARPLPDEAALLATYDGSIRWGRHLAARVRAEVGTSGGTLEQLQLVAAAGPVMAAAGRLPIGYGHGFGGGVTLTGQVPLNAIQLGTRTSVRPPGPLRVLGPTSLQTFLGRMREERHPGDPFIWGASGHFRPLERVVLGIHRAALFGGDPEGNPVTPRNVFNMLIGRVAGVGFEDQVVSVSARVRLPTEPLLPLEGYIEWGAEDSAGAWWHVPGRVFGVWVPVVPGADALSGGFEFAHFGTSCCRNPQWYRHWSFVGSWASGDRTLGHPLGGDGREYLVHLAADVPGHQVRGELRTMLRERRTENLFSPGRSGRSAGAAIQLEGRAGNSLLLELRGTVERGADWSEGHLGVRLEYTF